jgi:hypothetical protein
VTSAIALAPRPVARALDATPAVPIATATATAAPAAGKRSAVLVAPPKPKPPPAPGKAELKEMYPSLTWHKSQPNAEIPITQVPRGGVDLGSTHGKRLRVSEEQIGSAFDQMRQNQVLETAKVMQHNDLVQQKWDAAAAKASAKGKRLPPPPKLQPMPPLRPTTIASFKYKTSSNFFNRKDGVTKFVLVPPPGANAGNVDLSKATVKVASKEHSHGFFGSIAMGIKDGVKAVGKAFDKVAPYVQMAATALSFVPVVNVVAAPVAIGLAAYQGAKAIKNGDVVGAVANIGGAVAGGLGGIASLAAKAGATALEAGAKVGSTVAGLVSKGATAVGDFAKAVSSKSPSAWLAGAANLLGTAAGGLGGKADGLAGKLGDIAGGLQRGSQVAGAIEQGIKAKDPGAVLQGVGGAAGLLADAVAPLNGGAAGTIRDVGNVVGKAGGAVKQAEGIIDGIAHPKSVGGALGSVANAVDLGADVLGGIAPPIVKDIAGGVRAAGGIADAVLGAFGG